MNTNEIPAAAHSPDVTLLLHEEILLLALRDREGTFLCGPMYTHAMAGAMLAELALAERITIEKKRKHDYINVIDTTSTEEAVLDGILTTMIERKKPWTVQNWIMKIANNSEIKHDSAKRLCDLGVLREDIGKVLLVFSRRIYPEVDPKPEREIVARLREAILTEDHSLPVDNRTATLLALAHHAGLLSHHFDKKELKRHKKRIEAIIEGDCFADATQRAIQATIAAVTVACTIVPAITVATS